MEPIIIKKAAAAVRPRANDLPPAGRSRQQGYSMTQLAIWIGITGILAAAAIGGALQLTEDVNIQQARQDNAQVVIAAVALRTQTLGGTQKSDDFDETHLRAHGAPNILRTANDTTAVNAYNQAVTASTNGGGTAGLYQYGFGDEGRDACDNVAAYLGESSDQVVVQAAGSANAASGAFSTAANRNAAGLTITIQCVHSGTSAATLRFGL